MKSRSTRSSKFARGFAALSLVAASSALARPVPLNLTNGMDKIVENSLLQQGTILPPVEASATPALASAYKAAVAKEANAFSRLAITEAVTGNYLVDIMPDGRMPFAAFQSSLLSAFPLARVSTVDTNYAGHGVIEAYVSINDAWKIASFAGVRSVVLQLKPVHSVGAVTSQGINQHRVNRINTLYSNTTVNPNGLNYNGAGMSIGVMSDSYNSQPSMEGGATTAQTDVATGDLPGITAATPTAPNTQPVVVLEDYNPTPGATNEGRGMCQIVADIAPLARIGFATADTGEVGFANNIRALGGLAGFTKAAAIQQGFKGDVVCDDVSYLDEPMFQDGIVAQGVNDVVAAGVTYCSSAANNAGTDGYASIFRPVPKGTGLTAAAGNASLAGTNINLANVPPAYYAGGFHNFNPNAGQLDVAQRLNTGSASPFVFQWNDPYDVSAPTLGTLVYSTTGTSTGGSSTDYTASSTPPLPPFTAGQEYVIKETADTSLPIYNFDGIVSVIDPNGNVIVSQDSGTDEVVTFFAPVSGQYTIRVSPFSTAAPVGGAAVPTMGPYSLTVNLANGTPRITQDFNLLFFNVTTGAFISALASNNVANNRPIELAASIDSGGAAQVQLVIARSNTTTPAVAADRFRYVIFGNGASGVGPDEYFDYLAPVTFGHSAAAGANSVAAYSMFRPNLPEDFTSPGPVTVFFDANNNRLATPQLRLKPDIAAADGANNTFFPLGPVQDVPFDADTAFPNFYGTSAASPHAAAIAALVIQAHGGSGSLTPPQVKTLMQLNAFPHDLDPHSSGGTATVVNGGTVTVRVASDNSANTSTGTNDPNAWTVSYTGPGYLKELHFNPEATGATGGNPTGGNYSGGTNAATEISDFLSSANYKFTPGMVFNSNTFTYGTSTGLSNTDVVKTTTNAAPLPSTNAFFWTLNLAFPNSNFTTGKAFRFNVGRNQQQDAQTPQGMTTPSVLYGQTGQYSADILGDGVLIPEYADNPNVLPGMTFTGVVTDGTTNYAFNGRIANKIGRGYSPLDGYGFVNAQAATAAALPTPGVVSRKVHGNAGTFDMPLNLTGTPAVECRRPDASGGYQLVFSFARTVSVAGVATVTAGTATAATPVLGPEANQVTVNLSNVPDAQHLIVSLANVIDTSSGPLASVNAPVDVLIGDTGANGTVNAADVAQTRAQSGMATTADNYREDVNEDGVVNAADVALVRSRSGNSLSAASAPATIQARRTE